MTSIYFEGSVWISLFLMSEISRSWEERIYFLICQHKSNLIPKQTETLVYWINLSFIVKGWGCLLSNEFPLQESVNQGTYDLLSWYWIRKPCIRSESRSVVFKFSSFNSGGWGGRVMISSRYAKSREETKG